MRDITRQIWGFKKPRWRSKTLEIIDLKLLKEDRRSNHQSIRGPYQCKPVIFPFQGYKRQNGETKVKVKQFGQERSFHHNMDSSKTRANIKGFHQLVNI